MAIAAISTQATAAAIWQWILCQRCGRKVCRGLAAVRATMAPTPQARVEVICRHCKQVHYLGAVE